MEKALTEKNGFSGSSLKLFAVFCMTLDHIAWCFVESESVWGYILHGIGRVTAPMMTFFLAEGFHYTRSKRKYLLRLLLFAAVSHFPYYLMDNGLPEKSKDGIIKYFCSQSMIFTLFSALLLLCLIRAENIKASHKFVLGVPIFLLSFFGDWVCFPLVWVFIFDRFRNERNKALMYFCVMSFAMVTVYFKGEMLFQYGVMLAAIPLHCYNGKRGTIFGRADKLFFYIYYPAHMLILGILRQIILS